MNNWKIEIANSFIPYTKHNGEVVRLSNGKIEGKNSYIKKMLNLANGYSNFDRFRNRVIYCENYHETYSKEKLPNNCVKKFNSPLIHPLTPVPLDQPPIKVLGNNLK